MSLIRLLDLCCLGWIKDKKEDTSIDISVYK